MAEYKPRVGNAGVVIRIDMQEDITSATEIKFIVQKPNKTRCEWVPIQKDGLAKLVYIVQDGGFDQSGVYWIWPYYKLGAWKGECEPASFLVYD